MNVPILQIGEKVLYADEVPFLLHRYQVIPHIWRGIVIDEAIQDIYCTDAECVAAIKDFENKHCITSETERQNWLNNRGITVEQMQELAIRNLKIEKFKTVTWERNVESYFLKRKASLEQVIYSLIRHHDKDIAYEIFFRIQAGEQPFAELAREYSQGFEAYTGGMMGPFPLTHPHPAISKLLSVSNEGQLWSPRLIGEWYVILRLEKLLPAQFDEDMRQRLINELFEQWLSAEIQKIAKS
ncbi:MAG: peptidylprolyl isomerase [Scytonema sp. PMC 1069.18]|nr:peptidylprolyl isomerase [Scytonema sp. PMC 1069.18]MEC4880477.1 peptidylprolyl isomerase [Scytonema sp. PMC 1070.18]